MNYSWKLGRICEIEICLHWSFLIVPVWIASASLAAGVGWESAGTTIVFVVAVFACVLLHELGHALAARRYGIATRDITLLPIGGLARLEDIPRHPYQELVIALAGPIMNVAIAGAIGLGILVGGIVPGKPAMLPSIDSFVVELAVANLVLAVFNLLPAFPMDGGRVLRALLAMFVSYRGATRIAAAVGQGLAICLVIAGLFGSWNLLLVGLFVFVAARSEAGALVPRTTKALPQEVADDHGPKVVLPSHARATDVARALYSKQNYFPVLQGCQVVGVISKGVLLKALANEQGDRLVVELVSEKNAATPLVTTDN
jgi:Zn-dependent protease